MNNKASILIPIGDWITTLMRNEADIQTEEDIVRLVQEHSTADVARMAIASRHLGKSPQTILPADKMLLEAGGRAEIAHVVTEQKIKVQIGKREVDVPAFVGTMEIFGGGELEEGEKPDGYIPSVSKEAVQRATDYLLKRVRGHIRGRLLILMANGVPLGPIVEELKDTIGELVEELEA